MLVLPMYMGVILEPSSLRALLICAPHVYGGDPDNYAATPGGTGVLPMYMGVILLTNNRPLSTCRAPHVYGGDPFGLVNLNL